MLTNTVAPDSLGGLERYVRELSAGLVREGHEVIVLAKRVDPVLPEDEIGPDGVRVVRYSVPNKRDPSFAVRYAWEVSRAVDRVLRSESRTGRHDVVLHGHFPVPAVIPALRREAFVYTLHAPVWRELLIERQNGYWLPKPLQRAAVASLRSAERLVVRRALQVVVLSEFMRNEVVQLDAEAGRRTVVMPGGVDIACFSPTDTSKRERRASDAAVLFAARRHVPRTGLAELVQAMPSVLARLPQTTLRIAGEGPQTAAIAADIDRLGLRDRVTLLGRIDADQLLNEYRAADLAITPTQTLEGFGLATAEALACGTPCLVTPEGANPEVVAPLSPHLVARDSTPHGLAQGIIGLLTDRGTLEAVRLGARASVESRFSWPSIVASHLVLYTKIIARKRVAA